MLEQGDAMAVQESAHPGLKSTVMVDVTLSLRGWL